jgi:hypothetical protein
MKTTVHVQRSTAPVARAASIRLAALVSVIAAVAAVLIRLLTDIPQPAVVLAVIVVAFSISWHATWHGRHHAD